MGEHDDFKRNLIFMFFSTQIFFHEQHTFFRELAAAVVQTTE